MKCAVATWKSSHSFLEERRKPREPVYLLWKPTGRRKYILSVSASQKTHHISVSDICHFIFREAIVISRENRMGRIDALWAGFEVVHIVTSE
jgi:hypothetical protein